MIPITRFNQQFKTSARHELLFDCYCIDCINIIHCYDARDWILFNIYYDQNNPVIHCKGYNYKMFPNEYYDWQNESQKIQGKIIKIGNKWKKASTITANLLDKQVTF